MDIARIDVGTVLKKYLSNIETPREFGEMQGG